MTRNLKALGLALLAVFALGAIGAQGASAADEHEFGSDGQRTVLTGKNTNTFEYTVGAAGVIKCETVTYQSTIDAGAGKTEVDQITVKPNYSGCTFGGQPATFFVNDCAYVFDSDTTEGNSTGGGNKHANFTIECAANNKMQIHTVQCTVTFGAQEVKHAVRYEDDPSSPSAFNMITTAHGIVVGKERTTPITQPANGCLLFPTGAVGKFLGNMTTECRKDEDGSPQANATTPGATKDETKTECSVEEPPPPPEFHSDGEKTVFTGENTTPFEFAVGTKGTVKCEEASLEGTSTGMLVSSNTYKQDTLTLKPQYDECVFGGKEAEVVINDCAYVFDSETTASNPTGGEHANLQVECSGDNNKIELHTADCTVTVAAQQIEDAVRYENDPEDISAFNAITTAHGIEIGKQRTTPSQPLEGCATFPTGAEGKLVGTTTNECRKDEDGSPQANATTPGATKDETTTACEVTEV